MGLRRGYSGLNNPREGGEDDECKGEVGYRKGLAGGKAHRIGGDGKGVEILNLIELSPNIPSLLLDLSQQKSFTLLTHGYRWIS